MFSRDHILKALSRVIHPETKKDIVSMGMITELESNENGISLTLVPEKSNDPFINSIRSTIVRTLKEDLGPEAAINEIKVQPKITAVKHQDKPQDILPVCQILLRLHLEKEV